MDLVKCLTFSMILFLLGIWGVFLSRKNILIMLMLIQLMLLAVNLNFLVFSVYLDDMMLH
jgi:NADH:ubiquinone oxidoreductase subunit K